MWLWRFPVRLRISTLLYWKVQLNTDANSNLKRLLLVSKIMFILGNHFLLFKIYPVNITSLLKLINITPNTNNLIKPKYSFNKLFIKNLNSYSKPLKSSNNTPGVYKNVFYSFIRLNSWIKNKGLKTHHSFSVYYFYNNKSNLGFFNLRRTFNLWLNIVNFFKNIIFYKKLYTVFGNSYFKYEVLSLNYLLNKNFSIWRYTHLLIFFISNKLTQSLEHYLNYLILRDIRLTFIVDIFYHKRTVDILRKMKFVLIGPVPVTTNLYTLDIVLPVSSNSIFSNLFFMRLLLFLKREVSSFCWSRLNIL